MSEHTKTPWCTDELEHDTPYEPIDILGENGRLVCRFWIDDAPVHDYNAEQRANARHIVRCVNNHERLVALVKRIEKDVAETGRVRQETMCNVDGILYELQAEKGGE